MMDFFNSGFDLPRYEASFEVMEALYQESLQVPCSFGRSYRDLTLSFLRTVAIVALSRHKGVLWGHDV